MSFGELTAVIAAVFLACLVTPYGLSGIRYTFQLYQEIGSGADTFMKGVSELKSPSIVYQLSPPVVLYRALLGIAVLSAVLNYRKVRLSACLAFLAFWHLATMSVRNTAYFALIAAPFALQNLTAWRPRPLPAAMRRFAQIGLILAGLALSLFVATDRYYVATKDTKRFGVAWNPFLSVSGALDFAERSGLSGPYFNDILFGGYMIWRWHPQRPVFVDGRLEVYGSEFLQRYKNICEAPEAFWDKAVKDYGLRYAVVTALSPYSEKLIEHLSKRPDWDLAYADGFAAVYAHRARKARPALFDVQSVPPRPGFHWKADYPLLQLARAKFAVLVGDYESARKEYERALEVSPDLIDARYNLGVLLFRMGRLGEAESALEGIIRSRDNLPQVLSSLGAVYLREGKAAESIPVLERAVALQPDLGPARASLGTAYYLQKDYERAADAYRAALVYVPNDPVTHHNLGACLTQFGRKDEAAAEFRKALALKADYAEARQALLSLGLKP